METFSFSATFILGFLDELPPRVYLASWILLICLALFCILGIFLISKRMISNYMQRRDRYWNAQIVEIMTHFMVRIDSADHADPLRKTLHEFEQLPLKKTHIKQLLYKHVINYHRNFTGNTADKLRDLFRKLKLDSLTEQKLKSWDSSTKIAGILEAAEMQLVNLSPLIEHLIHSKSSEIRIEAQATYIFLNKQHSFHFLKELNEPILEWHQLILFNLITHIKLKELPLFSTWLDSSNPSVIELCLKLIAHFQQFEAQDQIIQLLEHPDDNIQSLAIKILGEFEAVKAEESLIKRYAIVDDKLKVDIIRALGRIASGKQLNFLLEAVNSPVFEIAFEATQALQNHGEPGISELRKAYLLAPTITKEMIEQVLA